MKRYDTYKDSGVQWIGEIPSHWEVLAVKHFCNAIYAGGTPSTNVDEYWNGDIDWLPSGVCHDNRVNSAPQKITELGVNNSSTKFIPAGTALLAMTGATCGHTAFCEIDAYANQSVTAYLNKKNKLDSLFLWYLLQSAHEYITTFQSGGAQGGINVEQCKNWILCFPSLVEQKAIAAWLDVKCGEIDKLIATQQRRIDLLQELRQSIITRAVTRGINQDVPMKPSGIDWIGDIPANWTLMRIKFLGQIRSGDGISNNEVDTSGSYEVYGGNGLMGYTERYNVTDNKIIIGRVGALCGNIHISRRKRFISDNALIFTPNSKANLEYLANYLVFADLNKLNTSSAQPLITGTKVMNVSIPLPTLAEQQEIVNYIERETAKVDAAIDKAERQIALLQELRQSVITEVVTGKRKVC